MQPTDIFLPALLLMFWTLTVLLVVPVWRVKAVMQRRITPQDFSHGESARVPPDVALPNRIFMNLVEVPVLYYALVAFHLVVGHADGVTFTLAWTYVALRLVHSLVYLSFNHVITRFAVFATSNLVVLAMIGRLAWALR